MKIIQANKFYYLRSGAARYLLTLSSWLQAQGHEIIPFAMQDPRNYETPFSVYFPSSVQTQQVHFRPSALKTVGRMLYSCETKKRMHGLVSAVKPDLCHVHNVYAQLSSSFFPVLKKAGVPIIMTGHDHHLVSAAYNIPATGCGEDVRGWGIARLTASRFHKQSFAASFAQALSFRVQQLLGHYKKHVDIFICPSEYMGRQMVAAGYDQNKIKVIPYGFDLAGVQPAQGHKGYALFVGRLSEEKGVEMVIHAAKLLPEITFKIAGTGPDEPRLRAMAHGCKNVTFEGFAMGDVLHDLYQGAFTVLLPSRVHENAPLTVLEAMGHGKPVIASDVGGVSELVEDRVSGLLVKPLSLHGWTEAISRLYYDSDYQQRLSKQARRKVEKDFRLEDHYRRVWQVYEQVTKNV
jgi:glycosyltransferase involved in cell wall biosynthesis